VRRTSIPVSHIYSSILGVVLFFVPRAFAEQKSFELDPAQTQVTFKVDSALHTVHGTFALKRGHITLDDANNQAGGELVVDATSGASGNGGRDGKMHKNILESQKFPEIIFTPQHFKGTLATAGKSHLEIEGQFSIHGQTHPMTLTVDVDFASAGAGAAADTTFEVPYIKWGMKDPSNFLLHVNDKVEISIHAVAKAAPMGQQPAAQPHPAAAQASSH